MIFYLAALQDISPELEEAAVISFKPVDPIFILTKGGPDNASSLLLYYIYEVAFSFWDTAYASTLAVVLLTILGGPAVTQFAYFEKGQLVLCTLAAYSFARFEFPSKNIAFILVLVQNMIMPDVLIVQNCLSTSKLDLADTILGIGLPHTGSTFGIFLLRQVFKQIPKELEDAARVEGAGWLSILLKSMYRSRGRPISPKAWFR